MELSNRNCLKNLYDLGFTEAKKLVEITNIHQRTIYRILNRIKAGNDMKRRPGGGRPSKLGVDDIRRITQLARRHPQWSSNQIAGDAFKRGSPKVSGVTVWRLLMSRKYFKFTPKKVPFLNAKMMSNRVEWCRKYKNFPWDRAVFTDESYFQMFRYKNKLWGKTRPMKMTRKHPPSFMVWGGISQRGATPLKIAKGSINSESYCQILEECLIPTMNVLYPDGWYLVQDNSRVHTSKYTTKWLRDHGVQVIEWPPGSPDLNPIENEWGIMKRRIDRENPSRVDLFKQTVQEIWDKVSHEELESLISSMPQRIQKCEDSKGDTIK
jgi:transposase